MQQVAARAIGIPNVKFASGFNFDDSDVYRAGYAIGGRFDNMGYFFAIDAIPEYHYMTLHKKILENDEQIMVERTGFWDNCKFDYFFPLKNKIKSRLLKDEGTKSRKSGPFFAIYYFSANYIEIKIRSNIQTV